MPKKRKKQQSTKTPKSIIEDIKKHLEKIQSQPKEFIPTIIQQEKIIKKLINCWF